MTHFIKNPFSRVKNAGFTLIELLVVVLIIGILASVALPQYQAVVARSRYQQAVLVAEAVVKAQRLYYLANGSYTTHFDDLDIQMPVGGTFSGGGEDNEWLNYPWGGCYMTQVYVNCSVQEKLLYESHYAGERFCIALNSKEDSNRVCRGETGAAPQLNAATKYNYYSY